MMHTDTQIVDVQFFKQFTICYKDKTMISREAMPLRRSSLLAYLIIHHDTVCSVSDLSDIFCPQSKKPEGALRNLVYRIRQALSDVWPDDTFILSRTGGYQWNPEIPLHIDTRVFDALYTQFLETEDTDTRIELGLQLFKLYPGDFDKLAQSQFQWIQQRSAYYRVCMAKLLSTLADALVLRGRSADIGTIALSAITNQYVDESLHQKLIQALLTCRLFTQAESYCRWLIDFLRSDLEIEPSEATFDLHAKAIAAATSVQTRSLLAILGELDAVPDRDRALYCELGIFKKMYDIAMHQVRFHESQCDILLVTLDAAKPLKGNLSLSEAMARIKEHLPQGLRPCDVYTQYAFNQFLILIPVHETKEGAQVEKAIYRILQKRLGKDTFTLERQHLAGCNPLILPPPQGLIDWMHKPD
ncbi:MAG: BTAD domain-containing putative transcriptional regulator [Pseudoramibacter sp.]